MITKKLPTLVLLALLAPVAAVADALTQIIQRDLETLGYEPGNTDGEATVETAIAISKFQSENGLEVTGEPSPQLAGIIKASMNGNGPASDASTSPASAGGTVQAAAAPAGDAAALQAAQQACLQQKMAEAQESQQRRRGLGRLARAFSRTATQFGGNEISSEVAQLSSDVYTAGAIADDVMGAAEDLGLTESDIEECRDPS
jgi:peptidoglycan hydrolase-like protein with peptidoglycan-binding domain